MSKQTAWLRFRKEYLKLNPPNHQGYYFCYICFKPVPEEEITVDHIIARTRAPGLVFNEDNLAICCYDCNNKKGSNELPSVKVDPNLPF